MEIEQKYLKEIRVSFPSRAVRTAFYHTTRTCSSRFRDEPWKFLSVWDLCPDIICSNIQSLSLLEKGNKGKPSEGASEGGT